MVLEKGLRLFGSSRSGREDFIQLIEFYKKYPDVLLYLENIVGSVINVKSIKDITNAFETDMHTMVGKTIMVWNK
jgi:ribitol-5-phosphate 2-dehydrogenase